jgi:hypothetical protein
MGLFKTLSPLFLLLAGPHLASSLPPASDTPLRFSAHSRYQVHSPEKFGQDPNLARYRCPEHSFISYHGFAGLFVVTIVTIGDILH